MEVGGDDVGVGEGEGDGGLRDGPLLRATTRCAFLERHCLHRHLHLPPRTLQTTLPPWRLRELTIDNVS